MQIPAKITFKATAFDEVLERLRGIVGCEVTESSAPALDEATGRQILPFEITHHDVPPYVRSVLACEPRSEDVWLLWISKGHIASLLGMLAGGILGKASSETQERNRATGRGRMAILNALRSGNTDIDGDTHNVWKSARRRWPDH
jgi:hypothetical protein